MHSLFTARVTVQQVLRFEYVLHPTMIYVLNSNVTVITVLFTLILLFIADIRGIFFLPLKCFSTCGAQVMWSVLRLVHHQLI